MGENDLDTEIRSDERVDAVVSRLDQLDDLDLPAQLQLFSELHTSLAAVLDADPEPDSAGGSGVTDGGQPPPPPS